MRGMCRRDCAAAGAASGADGRLPGAKSDDGGYGDMRDRVLAGGRALLVLGTRGTEGAGRKGKGSAGWRRIGFNRTGPRKR